MNKPFLTLVLASALAVGGCASTIGNRTDIASVTFEVGKTDKNTVANTLGLPANISRSDGLGREYWAYRDKPELVGVMYAMPTGGGTVSTFNVATGETGAYEFEDAAVVYVFDDAGVLVGVRNPEHDK